MKELKFSLNDKILVLAPHPDDESIGCAGLLLKYANLCNVIVLTNGCLGNPEWCEEKTIEIRKKEFEQAMCYANVNHYDFANIRDGDLNKSLVQFSDINLDEYDYIFCPNPKESHCDHKVVYKFIKKNIHNKMAQIVFYEVWSAMSNPTHYINLSDIVECKKKLISFYKSQLKYVDYKSRIIGLNHYRGMCPAVSYAEAYEFAK